MMEIFVGKQVIVTMLGRDKEDGAYTQYNGTLKRVDGQMIYLSNYSDVHCRRFGTEEIFLNTRSSAFVSIELPLSK